MIYYNISNPSEKADFRTATLEGQPRGGGLYFPSQIPKWEKAFVDSLPLLSKAEIGFRIMQPFVGDCLADAALFDIMEEVLAFEFPLRKIDAENWCLELFHGPTLAFKDLGARFLSRVMGQFAAAGGQKIIVLVATSGDTGGAVADAFHGVAGTEVIILYPSGKVSPVQEKQLTTHGDNIHALEVQGDFDDCQRLVKEAFKDEELKEGILLTSSNSINISRWLSQQIYYAIGMSQWREADKPIIAVPSGNFGNLCAGLFTQQSGLPVQHFIAACNANRVFTNYLESGQYLPVSSVSTISNAMDVGDPSNFTRIKELFKGREAELKENISSFSISDALTRKTIRMAADELDYVMDPHTAVAYAALEEWKTKNGKKPGIILGTAHSVKFPEVVEEEIQKKITLPEALFSIMQKVKYAELISPDYQILRDKIATLKK